MGQLFVGMNPRIAETSIPTLSYSVSTSAPQTVDYQTLHTNRALYHLEYFQCIRFIVSCMLVNVHKVFQLNIITPELRRARKYSLPRFLV
jgi:hypothetical protein